MAVTTLLLIVLAWCLLQTGRCQFMPGSSPATPNNALVRCQAAATVKPTNATLWGHHSYVINQWCSTYESMLPCLETELPVSNDPNDWFLNLVFNQTVAKSMSDTMCSVFPRLSNLTCVDVGLARVSACMQWTTRSAINHFYNLYDANSTVADENREAASIYACIITVATAGCFRRELKMCSIPKRKLLYDYYIMLSGRCKEIAGVPEKTETTTSAPESAETEPSTRRTPPTISGVDDSVDSQAPEDSSLDSTEPKTLPTTERLPPTTERPRPTTERPRPTTERPRPTRRTTPRDDEQKVRRPIVKRPTSESRDKSGRRKSTSSSKTSGSQQDNGKGSASLPSVSVALFSLSLLMNL